MKRPPNNGNSRNSARPFRNSAKCPVCGETCRTIKVCQVTPAITEITYGCTNDDCGFRWVGQLAPVRVLHASLLPPSRHLTPLPPPSVATAPLARAGAGG
ncbi:ogr/Delta-like zinc finger family protein [Rhodospira trueperi]|uniref:Ogr/Delta-like zinc finger n=1 Tax=Rhodospira trueperi TaxID=69960 RepID=A0A1G7D3E6_9PROT|nr:ogr/Delta-like zinc finger family protein [Rhodospira trueperi]SDE46013.1 Ogr/Delta-like zinc finger [Rhodospira trueperi]